MMPADPCPFADELERARRDAFLMEIVPDGILAVADAYRVQAELIRRAGGVLGWKVTAVTREAQATFGTEVPVVGALLPSHVHVAPAELALSDFIAPLIECEIAFVLGADLPRRNVPYSRGEVEAAIAAVVPAFEFPDTRLPADATEVEKLADVMANGSFVAGKPFDQWRELDLVGLPIELFLDGHRVAQGTGGAVPGGDPVAAIVALANAYPLPSDLKAGQIVTTGTCTTPLPVRPGSYRANFGALGAVQVEFKVEQMGNEAT